MEYEHRDRESRPWVETTEERVRSLVRATYGEDREAWAMGQLERGHVVQVGAGEVRKAPKEPTRQRATRPRDQDQLALEQPLDGREDVEALAGMVGKMPPYVPGSGTSIRAAQHLVAKAPTKRVAVLAWWALQGERGATDEEAILALSTMSPNTPRARRVELRDAGLVRDSGRTRETRAGEQATVWVAAPHVRALLGA